jgi:serine/threonine protein kinase
VSIRPRAAPVDIELDAAAYDDLPDPSQDDRPSGDEDHAITEVSVAGFGGTGMPAATRALVPATVGKYAIVREIGRGTTSTVYHGIDPFTRREVAIKVVRPPAYHDSDEARRFRKAFLNEASLAGRLAHPHVVEILDAGSVGDCNYIAMEYVAGGTLQAYCAPEARLAVARVVEIVFKASLALRFARNQGLIHRDIKPANILVRPDLDIKITDFGSAQFEGRDSTQLTGVGSPAYMSPEQILEQPLTQQTDIYSLGVVAYQLLTGRLPFRATSRRALLAEILSVEAVAPSTLCSEVPAVLDSIVLRALRKTQAQRYATWEAFTRDLATAFRNLPGPDAAVPGDAQRFETLRGLPLFSAFSEIELWETLRIATWCRLPAGAVVVREDGRNDALFVLVDGTAAVTRGGRTVDVLGPGDCFGELLYFRESAAERTTTVATATPVTLIEVRAAALRLASDRLQVQFNRAFMRILVSRLDRTATRLAERPDRSG